YPGLFNAQLAACIVGQLNGFQDSIFFNQVASLPQRYMGGYMDDPEMLFRQHHGVLAGMGILGVYFRMSCKLVARHIQRLFMDRSGNRSVNLPAQSQLNVLFNGFKRYMAVGPAHGSV